MGGAMSITEIDVLDEIEIEDAPVSALSPRLQSIARNYIGARARAGGAILDAARYLAEARATAKRGEWGIFLESTGTQEDTASRMIAIANRADTDQQYARAINDGRLAFTAAFELLSAPAETQQHALESEMPTPASTIRHAKQELKLRTSAEFVSAPESTPLPSEDERHRITIEAILKEAENAGERTGTKLYQQAYDHAREIHDLVLHNKMIALIDRATDHLPTDAVTPFAQPDPAHIERLEAQIESDRIPEASTEIAPLSDRAVHMAKEMRDAGRLERARSLIAHGDYDAARVVLDQIEVSTRAADLLRNTIPAERPAMPPRPKRPVSADASAVIAYLKQLETYASALETLVMTILKVAQ